MYGLGIAQPQGTQILQIYWIYKDAIDLPSRWKVRFIDKLFFFKMKFKECFISWCWLHTLSIIFVGLRIYSPSNFRLSQKTKTIKFVPITIITHLAVCKF